MRPLHAKFPLKTDPRPSIATGLYHLTLENLPITLKLPLEPYNGDPTTQKLRPNPKPPESVEQIDQGGEAGISWPLDIAFAYGKCVTITGRLVLAPTYRSWKITDPDAEVSDRLSQTVSQHERYHGLYAKSEWNANLNKVNYWEGCYCTERCADLAASIAQALNRAAYWQQVGRQVEYDKIAYAQGTSLENKYNFLGNQAAGSARVAAQEARRLIADFISKEGCSKATANKGK